MGTIKVVSQVIPDYKGVLLRSRAKSDSLVEWLEKEYTGKASIIAMKVIKALARGRTVLEVAEDIGVDESTVGKMKRLYFDPGYMAWYKKTEGGGGEGGGGEGKGPGRVHERMVERVFKPTHQRVTVTVEFHSKFNSTGEFAARGDDPEFKWKEYRAEIRERSGEHTLQYTFAQRVDETTGKLVGEPVEVLKVDGKPVGKDSALMKMIQEGMKKYVLPDKDSVRGITPMQSTFSVHYVNTFHGDREIDWEDFQGVEDFVEKHHGLFHKDDQHRKFEDDKRDFEERKKQGPGKVETEAELNALINRYERDLKLEKDTREKEIIKRKIKELKDLIKGDRDLEQKELDDLIRQELLIRHPTHVVPERREVTVEKPEVERVAMMGVYALELPPVGSGHAKEFLDLAKKLGGRNLDRWLDDRQLVQLAKQVSDEIDRQRVTFLGDSERVKRLENDGERFLELLPDFIKDLKVRIGIYEKHNPVDYETLKKNRDIDWINDSGKVDRVLEDAHKAFKGSPALVVLPGPKGEDAQKLISLFYSYGLTHNPNPKLWLEPNDLIVLARAFNGAVAAKLKKELKSNKPKGVSEEDWKHDIEKLKASYAKDLQDAEELFPKFVDDLKARRDDFAKEHPLDYKALASKKNVEWVDSGTKVKEVLGDVIKALHEGVKPDEKKQPGVKIIEIGKFDALAGFLRSQLKGFLTLGSRFKRLGLNPVGSEERIEELRAARDKIKEDYNRNFQQLNNNKDLGEEEKNALMESKKEISKTVSDMTNILETHETIPAVKGAKILQSYLKYFSSLFTIFTSMLWYRNKYSSEGEEKDLLMVVVGGILFRSEDGLVWAADEMPVDEESKKLSPEGAKKKAEHLQEDIYYETHHLSGLRLKPKEGVKEGLTNLRTLLSQFLDVIEQTRAKSAATEDYEEAYKRYVIPEDLLHQSREIIDKMRKSDNPKVKDLASDAEKEFKVITKNLVDVFREGFTDEKIREVADKKKVSPEKAAVQLQHHRDALTKAAMDAFLIAWHDVIQHEAAGSTKFKRTTPLGNKPAEEYERMGQFVEDHVPELFALEPPHKEVEGPSPGIPTPEEIRTDIERMWTLEKEPTPEEMAKLWKIEADEMGFGGGGGGGKRKTRFKPIKTPPPSGVWQQIVHTTADKLKDLMKKDPSAAKSGMERLVIETLMRQILVTKKHIAKMKADEHLEVDDVIDGLVFLVKQLFNTMLNLKVQPSIRQLQNPPPGAPDFTGTPDVPVDNLKEAKEFFKAFTGMVDVINEYLDPHKINIPKFQYIHPEKGSRRQERYFPNGFMETMEFFQMQEHGPLRPSEEKYKPLEHIPSPAEEKMKEKEKHPKYTGHAALYDFPSQMSANIAAKFAGAYLTVDEFEALLS